jgi:hypothetical protein
VQSDAGLPGPQGVAEGQRNRDGLVVEPTLPQKASQMPPPLKIIKELPKDGDLQLFLLEKPHQFHCMRCGHKKKSPLVAVLASDWSKLFCNGCYGEMLSKGTK